MFLKVFTGKNSYFQIIQLLVFNYEGAFCHLVFAHFKMRNRSTQADNSISEVLWKQTNKCIKYSQQHGNLTLFKYNSLGRAKGSLGTRTDNLPIFCSSITEIQHRRNHAEYAL